VDLNAEPAADQPGVNPETRPRTDADQPTVRQNPAGPRGTTNRGNPPATKNTPRPRPVPGRTQILQ
jgi:hypothetical protein